MRMDQSAGPTAADLVNRLPEDELAEPDLSAAARSGASRRIARAIVAARQRKHLATTAELAEVVRRAAGRSRRPGLDPATRTFQALRIAVNGELDDLEGALRDARGVPGSRRPPGRDRLPQPRGPAGEADLPRPRRGRRLHPAHQEAGAARARRRRARTPGRAARGCGRSRREAA